MRDLVKEATEQVLWLRRYARALTGSQVVGDAYVSALCEHLVQERPALAKDEKPRVVLYRLFTAIYNSTAAPGAEKYKPSCKVIGRTPLPRQAFLLVCVEGFSPEEAAHILHVDPARVNAMIEETKRGLSAQPPANVLLLNRDPFIMMELESILEDLGHRVVAAARTHAEAVKKAAGKRLELVFANTIMADGSSGLDAAGDLAESFHAAAIFVTGYPQRLLTGQRREPVFVIDAPFQPLTIVAMTSQVLFLRRQQRDATSG